MVVAVLASAAHAVPVASVGWSTSAIVGAVQTVIVTLLGGGGLFGLFKGVGYLWSIQNQRAAQDDTRDASARKAASDERAADFERLREQIDRQDAKINSLEEKLQQERDRHDAERRLERHKLRNITQCFDALVLLLETNPERAPEALMKVKAMRTEQMRTEALEIGAALAPAMAAPTPGGTG